MQKIKQYFKSIIQRNHKWILFMISFTFFICLGLMYSRYNPPILNNIFFGADSVRAFDDLIHIKDVTHYRIKVHPLMLILLQPIMLFINGLVQHAPTTIILAGSLAGALNTIGIYDIISRYLKNTLSKYGIIAIYVCSFSTMVFTTIPETFIFASVYLIMFWNFILKHLYDRDELTYLDYIILVFFGIANFGITLTNYVQYLIGLLGLFFVNIKSMKIRVKNFIYLNLANVFFILLLSKLQQRSWRGDTPFFPKTLTFLHSDASTYEDTLYMNFTISLDKLKHEIFQTCVYPLMGGNNYINYSDNLGHWLSFSAPSILQLIFAFVAFFSLLYFIIRTLMYEKRNRYECIVLLSAWLFNIFLHFIYGSWEAFLYSQHFIFLPIIIFAIGLSKFENKKFSFFIIFFVIVELIANLISYHDALQSVNIILYHHTIPLVQVIPKIFFIGCCILILGVLLGVWIKREALKLIHIKTITYQRKIIFLIEIYLLLIITITLWIHVNYPLIEK